MLKQLLAATRPPLAALLLTLPLAGQATTPQKPEWPVFVDHYIESFLVAHPAFAVVQGRHEFDGQLPDWSKEGIAREIARLKAQRQSALAYRDEDLTAEQQYQRDYLVSAIDGQLFWLDDAEWPFRSPDFYFSWLTDSIGPSPYISLTYAPPEERIQSFTRYANNLPTAIAQIRDNLRMPMPRTVLRYGIDSFGGLAAFFRDDVAEAFASVKDEKLLADFNTARENAASAIQGLADYLESNRATATEDYAMGPELFRKMIYATERVDISLKDLEAIGRADMARNQAALKQACAEFAPGKPIAECFAKMANRKPEGGPVAAARRQLEETKAFVIAKDLVTIPGKEEALVQESPPYARSNAAFINIAGPYEKDQPSIYNISPPNPAWPKDVQEAYIPGESDLLFTSVHEVWPGHFLNFVHANRAEFTFGRVFVTYAFGEGWAHYTEEMMLEAGLRDRSPETRIGQLANALLRNARFLSAIGLHTQGMSIEESEKLFMEQAYQDKGTAEQQAARGTYDPAYLNYTLGKLMIRQLRDDWVKERGGRDAWRQFHDEFLSYGGPPIPLVRGQMLGGDAEAVFYRGE
ncbi:DUF885 domain-containing protein [Parahaliea maris]|uniref:DUF885 domain-containing protein n=1 Tax=Parahaliea maris TaxID=2716870 RepID=A0A5C9A8H1_9GAMM|nr:DUF885 domain-containing protein [Parahaliea maris]TXS95521.1 DUF885 domain-containing protein [Parahaliea maris]